MKNNKSNPHISPEAMTIIVNIQTMKEKIHGEKYNRYADFNNLQWESVEILRGIQDAVIVDYNKTFVPVVHKTGGNVGELKMAKILLIDGKNPLSTQLQKETGESLNDGDYNDIGVSNFNIVTHKKTGKVFIVYPARLYEQLDKAARKDDIDYLRSVEQIEVVKAVEFAKGGGVGKYVVRISNAGSVSVNNKEDAELMYLDYVKKAKAGSGVHSGENVALLKNGKVIEEYIGKLNHEKQIKFGSIEDIKKKMYSWFQAWLDGFITDEELVTSLKRKLSNKWFRFYSDDTLARDWQSVQSSISTKNNREYIKEDMQVSLEQKGLRIFDSKGNELFGNESEKKSIGGALALGAVATGATVLLLKGTGKEKAEETVKIPQKKLTWKENVILDIDKEGFDYTFDGYSDYKNVKDKKFHVLRKAYLSAYNQLKNYIDKKYKNKKVKNDIVGSIEKEGFDYALTGYNDWKKEIKDKKFHELRNAYIAKRNALSKYIGLTDMYGKGGGVKEKVIVEDMGGRFYLYNEAGQNVTSDEGFRSYGSAEKYAKGNDYVIVESFNLKTGGGVEKTLSPFGIYGSNGEYYITDAHSNVTLPSASVSHWTGKMNKFSTKKKAIEARRDMMLAMHKEQPAYNLHPDSYKYDAGGSLEDKYKVIDGTSYHKETPQAVINVLEQARKNNTRIKIYYGDVETGRDWHEEHETVGTIGRSTGTIKVPLMIVTKRSMGGGAILDHRIVKMKRVSDGTTLYKNPKYIVSEIEIRPIQHPKAVELKDYNYSTFVDGELYGRHKTLRSAELLKKKLMANGGGVGENYLIGIGSEISIPQFGVDKNVKMKLTEIIPLSEKDIANGLGKYSYHFVGSKGRSQYYPETMLKNKIEKNEINFIKKLADGGCACGFAKGGGIGKYDTVDYEDARSSIEGEFSNEKIEDAFTKEDVEKLAVIVHKLRSKGMEAIDVWESNDVQDYLTNLSASYKNKMKKGGTVKEIEYQKIFDVLKEKIDDAVENVPFEGKSEASGTEVEHKFRDGFIPFTNGGYQVAWYESLDILNGSGNKLPTAPLAVEMQRQIDYGYQLAKDRFKEEHPDIVEKLSMIMNEENIDYSSLYDAGYSSEAEELSEWESEYNSDSQARMRIFAYYFEPTNDKGENGKHTISLQSDVNLEAPYHREGNMDDFKEIVFNFDSIADLEKKMDANLKTIVAWFKGSEYDESTREMKVRKMGKGGGVDDIQKTFDSIRDLILDRIIENSVEVVGESPFVEMEEIAHKEASKVNFDKFCSLSEKISNKWIKEPVIEMCQAVKSGKFKKLFRFTYGGKAGSMSTVSQVSSFFDLYLQAYHYEQYTTGGGVKEKVYDTLWFAINEQGKKWEELPQHPLENKTWKQAVERVKELVKSEKAEIRLSTTKGYGNQGHYFHPSDFMAQGGELKYHLIDQKENIIAELSGSSFSEAMANASLVHPDWKTKGYEVEKGYYASGSSVRHSSERKSPTDSATWHEEGHQMIGNDGNLWEIRVASNGVRRWVKIDMLQEKIKRYVPSTKYHTEDEYAVVIKGKGEIYEGDSLNKAKALFDAYVDAHPEKEVAVINKTHDNEEMMVSKNGKVEVGEYFMEMGGEFMPKKLSVERIKKLVGCEPDYPYQTYKGHKYYKKHFTNFYFLIAE